MSDAAELDLSEEESLPWLESDEEDDDGGVDTARIIGFTAILLVVLAGVIGAVWFVTNKTGDQELVADGSTIVAPEGPYKERPDDPGGKEFAGTGNVAPAVGEGQSRDGVVAEAGEGAGSGAENGAGAGGSDATGTASGSGSGANSGSTGPAIATRSTEDKPAASSAVGVQVGAYGTRAKAEAGWVTLTRQTSVLSGVRHRVQKGEADIGTVYRLQALAGNLAAAQKLCSDLKADGVACQVKR